MHFNIDVLTRCRWFGSYYKHDYARSGNVASSTVELDEGPLHQFSHSIEPHLRKLGLPVTLKKGGHQAYVIVIDIARK